MIGGFGAAGQPVELIEALIRQGATNLTVVKNNAGNGDRGLAALIGAGRVRKMICSFPRQAGLTPVRRRRPSRDDRARAGRAGQPGRTDPGSRRWDRRLLHPHRLRHASGRGQGDQGDRRSWVHPRVPNPRRLRAGEGACRRWARQSGLSQDSPQLRAGHGHRRANHDRSGPGGRPHRRARPGKHRHSVHLHRSHRRRFNPNAQLSKVGQ